MMGGAGCHAVVTPQPAKGTDRQGRSHQHTPLQIAWAFQIRFRLQVERFLLMKKTDTEIFNFDNILQILNLV